MSDKTVIQGGHVIDGTGIPGRETNIAVVDGLIVDDAKWMCLAK